MHIHVYTMYIWVRLSFSEMKGENRFSHDVAHFVYTYKDVGLTTFLFHFVRMLFEGFLEFSCSHKAIITD